ncbi:MAG: permease-like cell division protein FtsX [Candidatus Velthaea sp.]
MTSEGIISVDLGRLRFFLGEVAANFTRNAAMQFTAIGTVAVTIVMLGAFLYVRETIASFGTGVLSKIEVAVYLKDDVNDARAKAIAVKFAADKRISGATYIPRREGLRRMKDVLGRDFDTSLLTTNPLPNAFHVRVRNPDDVVRVAASIGKYPGVAKTEYAAETVTKLLRVADVLARVGVIMIALLVVTAAIIISNTIRLTVFARRREIAIMQLVGATNMYIRMPFIAEGMLAGVLGAGLALGVLLIARTQIVPKLAAMLTFVPFHVNESMLALQCLAVGAAVGFIAAWLSVGRHLRA